MIAFWPMIQAIWLVSRRSKLISANHPQPVSKRRIALLRSLKKITEAITALIQFLDSSPTDAEAWAELADLYLTQGMYQQAIFALEEVLLVTPYAWNVSIPSHPFKYLFSHLI
jgi:tetratricopeptide (TPR) repeat protein